MDRELGYRGQLLRAWQTAKTGSPLPPWAHDIAELEQRAQRIELVSPHVVPGLLQSPGYMELIMRRNFLTPASIGHLLKARAKRYEVLAANGDPDITSVFPVTAITLVPDTVRREQAARLVELIDTKHVEVHLIPQEDLLVGLMSPLMMFYLAEGGEIAASEHVRGAIIYGEMEEYDRLHDRIKAALGRALPPARSRRFLEGEICR
ncbi:hypothetical protein BJF83_24545 [Nocardiopsis sp. CNR-923]|nr:hypothetical protein BJF83_24545 [Nocardiopsis sp. CNR-923]